MLMGSWWMVSVVLPFCDCGGATLQLLPCPAQQTLQLRAALWLTGEVAHLSCIWHGSTGVVNEGEVSAPASDLGSKSKTFDLETEPHYDHHIQRHLKWDAPERKLVISEWQDDEFAISGDLGAQHLLLHTSDKADEEVSAPNDSCWKEAIGQTLLGLCSVTIPIPCPGWVVF